jgi:hypothetical protein
VEPCMLPSYKGIIVGIHRDGNKGPPPVDRTIKLLNMLYTQGIRGSQPVVRVLKFNDFILCNFI